ncbi:transporter [Caulobacter sp. CCUG 60055]|nr:transporter [Caulobacter sp. CCUG 60055]
MGRERRLSSTKTCLQSSGITPSIPAPFPRRDDPARTGELMKRLLIGGLMLTPLGACALGAAPPAPDLRTPAAYEAPAGQPLAAQALDRWWTLYGDAQLESLVERALAEAPDARTAAAKLREAQAVRRQALWATLPQGDIQGSAAKTRTDQVSGAQTGFVSGLGESESETLNFNVSWELDLWGKLRAARRAANADLAGARFDYESSRAALAASVADSLFQARGLAVQLDDARETLRIQRALHDVAAKKAGLGLAPSSDADRTAADVAQSEAQAASLAAQLQAARRTLLVLVGRGADPLDSLPAAAAVGTAPPPPAAVPGDLLARRPDVRQAQTRFESALGRLSYDKRALFPSFTLKPGVGLTRNVQPGSNIPGVGVIPGLDSTTSNWTLGAGLTVPVLDLPKLLAEVRAQNARAEQAGIAYEKAVQTAYSEAENALVGLNADENGVRLLTAGEAKARSAYDAARKGYGAGLSDLTSALQAEQQWRAARTALTGAQVQALRRSVQTFKALGGGWSPAGLAQQPAAPAAPKSSR